MLGAFRTFPELELDPRHQASLRQPLCEDDRDASLLASLRTSTFRGVKQNSLGRVSCRGGKKPTVQAFFRAPKWCRSKMLHGTSVSHTDSTMPGIYGTTMCRSAIQRTVPIMQTLFRARRCYRKGKNSPSTTWSMKLQGSLYAYLRNKGFQLTIPPGSEF